MTDDPFVHSLMDAIGLPIQKLQYSRDIAPGSHLSIIKETPDRHVSDAIWWLFLDKDTLKPNYRYASFNSRYNKLNQSRSISYHPYRESRCVIPASGYVEGLGDNKTYFHLMPKNAAIAFGGLYKEWVNHETGEHICSASIITLLAHDKLKNIHPNSMPLMLNWHDKKTIELWLDPDFQLVEAFNELLKPHIPMDLIITVF